MLRPTVASLMRVGLLTAAPAWGASVGNVSTTVSPDRCEPPRAVAEAVVLYRAGGSARLLERLVACRTARPCGPSMAQRLGYCAALDQAAVVLDEQAVRTARNDGHDDKYPGDARLGRVSSQRRIAAACRSGGLGEDPAECLARADRQRKTVEAYTLQSLQAVAR